jgi:hypothetical protein
VEENRAIQACRSSRVRQSSPVDLQWADRSDSIEIIIFMEQVQAMLDSRLRNQTIGRFTDRYPLLSAQSVNLCRLNISIGCFQ